MWHLTILVLILIIPQINIYLWKVAAKDNSYFKLVNTNLTYNDIHLA